MNLIFAKPTYGPSSDPGFDSSHRRAIMHAANKGITWVGDLSPDRQGWSAARNFIASGAIEIALDNKVDGVFWVDDDLVIPKDTITRLTSHNLDFVSGLYFQRALPFRPVFGTWNKKDATFDWPGVYEDNIVTPWDGVGFGCSYTSLRLLKLVSDLPGCKENGPFGGDFQKKTYGEDFTFCLRALEVGIRPHLDTSVKCRHYIGPKFSDEDLYRKFMVLKGGQIAKARQSDPEDSGYLRQECF